MYTNVLLKWGLFLGFPPVMGYVLYLLWGFPVLFVTAIIYLLLLLFSVPAGEDIFSTFSNYQGKRDNPTFKSEKNGLPKKIGIMKLIAFLFLFIVYMLIYIETV